MLMQESGMLRTSQLSVGTIFASVNPHYLDGENKAYHKDLLKNQHGTDGRIWSLVLGVVLS